MRSPNRIAITAATALAALMVTVSMVAGPAVADEVPTTTAADPAVEYVPDPDVGVAPAGDGVETQASGAWSPGTEKGPDGKWIAYIEVAGGFVREEVGTYETRREARKAAKAAANEANGFVAGPGCDDPLVLC